MCFHVFRLLGARKIRGAAHGNKTSLYVRTHVHTRDTVVVGSRISQLTNLARSHKIRNSKISFFEEKTSQKQIKKANNMNKGYRQCIYTLHMCTQNFDPSSFSLRATQPVVSNDFVPFI